MARIQFTAFNMTYQVDINGYAGWEIMKNYGAYCPANDYEEDI